MSQLDTREKAETAIRRLQACYEALQGSLGQVLIGQATVVKLVATGLFSGGHMLIIGVPGLAKTLIVKTLAHCLGWEFRRIQFTPDVMPADITGTEILQSEEGTHRRSLVFRKGPLFANLILADEINRTPPKTQAALLEAMQELSITVGGVTYPLTPPFVVVATQNPIEQEGTYPLPEAQLDRFLLSIHVDYPTRDEERAIAARPLRIVLPSMSPLAERAEFLDFIRVIDDAPVPPHVLEYAVSLVSASRPKSDAATDFVRRYVAWGAGPRATQHLVTASKASALLEGRPSPEPQDVRDLALPVLRHRIIPNYNALGEGLDAGRIVEHLLEAVRPGGKS
ncbi:MAG: MoxR family ATPase [Planctomycetes bacterium]|nr:MoxR family ATPase [Planctomycetota bacterium]